MKNIILLLIGIVLIGIGVFAFTRDGGDVDPNIEPGTEEGVTNGEEGQVTEEVDESMTVIGTSVEGRDITAYHYGAGETELLFVGGIHGGYSWNTALVAFEMMDYLESIEADIPANVRVTVIPVLNPDGLNQTVGTTSKFSVSDVPASSEQKVAGRFNANDVDLNRNFDCDWQTDALWQNTKVSGGAEVFSEPESRAFRDYVQTQNPDAVVVWYSAAGGVFASSCHNGVLDETRTLTNLYADASGYKAFEEFDFYEITGDMVNWLAKENVPAISVLLTTHETIEWTKNQAGLDAMLERYGR